MTLEAVNALTESERNRKIAEILVWTEIRHRSGQLVTKEWPADKGEEITGQNPNGSIQFLPSYSTSLDAMHEAENILSSVQDGFYNSQSLLYTTYLVEMTGGYNVPDVMYRPVHATADQRHRAFLMVMA